MAKTPVPSGNMTYFNFNENNMELLKGKTALVTGGGRDIGSAVCIALAAAGAQVCINYCNAEEQALQTLEQIKQKGGKAITAKGDMTNSNDVNQVVKQCTEAFGNRIDILVNVTGGLVARKTMEEMDEAFWDKVINLNVKTVFLVTQKVLPYMTRGSAIINFTSQAARDGGGAGAIAYATGKGAVLTMTRGLAKELGPKGIRVNAVSPGMINTTFHNTFTKSEVREKVAAATSLRREGESAEVANLVLYLASENASFINGESVEINGGSYFA
jgi:3-oxoacyl-[acyl-carrier protein] reductase